MADKSSVAVLEKLILDIGGKKIELTKEQAKALHEALGELFGVKVVERIVPKPYQVVPPDPIKPWRDQEPWKPLPDMPPRRKWNEIWCRADDGLGQRVTLRASDIVS